MNTDEDYTIKFRCNGCGEHSFKVRWRRENEDIAEWFETVVTPGLGRAHLKLSPLCRAPTADLMMPVDEAASAIGRRVLS